MPVTREESARGIRLARGTLHVEIALRPFALSVVRGRRRLVRDAGVRIHDGTVHDQFVQLTEGVLAGEDLSDPVAAETARPSGALRDGVALELAFADGTEGTLTVRLPAAETVALELRVGRPALRLVVAGPGHPEQQFAGLGTRHGLHADQAGRAVQLGADRRYAGPDCPPDMLLSLIHI